MSSRDFEDEFSIESVLEEISKEETEIQVRLEKRKFGKPVTVLKGFPKDADIKRLASELKNRLACGGSAKDGIIALQGDHRREIKKILEELGYNRVIVL
ncbi:MAG: stress response translation initiation inhibitor YciH [Candidatus Asgardarchaeia archaeon]